MSEPVDDPTMTIAELIVDSKGGRTPLRDDYDLAEQIVQYLTHQGWCPPELVGPILEQVGGSFTLRVSAGKQATYTVDHFVTDLGEPGIKVARFD